MQTLPSTPTGTGAEPAARHSASGRRRRLERRRHQVAVTVALIALGATGAGWEPTTAAALAIVVVAVAVGMPHGALDIVIGPGLVKPSVFFGAYLAVGAATVLIWLAAPLLGAGVFFAASWFHFARGDAEHHRQLGGASSLLGISTAGCAIGLPLALHGSTVAPVLSDLLLGTAMFTPAQVAVLGAFIAVPSIVAGVVAGIAAVHARRAAAVTELLIIGLLGVVTHPLVSFALYFSLWHSPRHLIAVDLDRRAAVPTLAATVLTLLVGAVVWYLVEPSTAAATQVVFIGLAALTGPHLVVTEALRRHASRPDGIRPRTR